ncbi:MAG: flagellar hook-length control protein FliK [Zoogloeaceae bacterium]|nr:flagellar hook-length control protein FliK [Zoogloeaceae bacterium]
MSIQLVSASAVAANPLAGVVPEGAAGAGGFSGLMGLLLADAEEGDAATIDLAALLSGKDVPDAPEDAIQAALAQLLRQAKDEGGMAEPAQAADEGLRADAAVEEAAPDGMALPLPAPDALLAALSKAARKSPEQDKETEAATPLLGALSTPVEIPRETVLRLTPETPGQGAGAETAGMTHRQIALALAGKDAEVLSQRSANLAVGAEDFAQTLRESLLQGQSRNAAPTGASMNPPNAGGMRQDALAAPLSSPAWAREFGERIVWMARNDQHQARLSLYPAHLGPLSVTLNLEADRATAAFTAATQEARQAIEDALPRLREMFAAAGLSLGQTEVGAEERQPDAANGQPIAQRELRRQHDRDATEGGDGTILEPPSSAGAPGRLRQGAGMVDLFA